MGLTYAGQPLILDFNDQVRTYLDRYIPQAFHTLFCPTPPAVTNGEWVPKDHIQAHVGVPVANWSPPTDLRLNTLYWPSGASRWGYGLFLVDSPRLQKIREAITDTGDNQDLRLHSGTWPQMRVDAYAKMRMLPPLELPTTGPGHGEQLYLLTLVDQRYFWQWRDAGSLEIDENDSWLQLITQLQEQLDLEIEVDGIPGGYYYPNVVEFSRSFHNAAMLLDAVAWSAGMRVSLKLDGTVYLNGPLTDSFRLNDNRQDPYHTAGGKAATWHNQMPEHIRVVFPRGQNEEPEEGGGVYALTYTTQDVLTAGDGLDHEDLLTMPAGTVETYFTSFLADFTVHGGHIPTIPLNRDLCLFLALQIATDIVEWRHHGGYDLAFPGLHTGLPTVDGTEGEIDLWTPTGYDDWIEVHFDPETPVTRVRSMPPNWRANKLLNSWPPRAYGSESSSSCSSSSTSTSSVSESSSEGDSQETSGSMESRSVTVVTDVYCEDGDIVVCTRELTFPFKVQIGPEDCGEAESSQSSQSPSSQSSVNSSSGLSESSGLSSLSSISSSSSCSVSSSSSVICGNVVQITAFGIADPDPLITGAYTSFITHNAKPLYVGDDEGWFLWWDADDGQWIISETLGSKTGSWWEGLHPTPRGDYNPHGTSLGALMGDC